MPRTLPLLAALSAAAMASACTPKAPPPLDIPHPNAVGLDAVKTLEAPYSTGDAVAGREAFALCVECHSVTGPGYSAKGPSLEGVFGAKAASKSDFGYSEALRASGMVWDAKHLDHWIFNPREALPGTSMGFIGIRADQKRYDVVAYIAAMSAQSKAP